MVQGRLTAAAATRRRLLYTAPGAAVDAAGCSAAQRDSDGDGVKDNVDLCPATALRPKRVCDVNLDSSIDARDIRLILESLGKKATGADDPRDANRNGKIDLIDAAICASKCDRLFCRAP